MILAVVIAIMVLLVAGGLIGMQLAGIANEIPRYATTIENKISTAQGATVGRLSRIVDGLGKQVEHAGASAGAASARRDRRNGRAPAAPKPIPVTVQQPSADPLALARTILAPMLAPFESR